MSSTLPRPVLKSRDPALALPKFDVVAVNQVFGVLSGGFIIGTEQLDRPDEAPLGGDDMGSAVRHRALCAGSQQGTGVSGRVCALWSIVYSLLGSSPHVFDEQLRKLLTERAELLQDFALASIVGFDGHVRFHRHCGLLPGIASIEEPSDEAGASAVSAAIATDRLMLDR
jgi:hypothetical protein